MTQPQIIKIDSRVSGYDGEPVRVLAVCIPDSGKVLVQKIAPYREPIKSSPDTVLVTDSPSHHANWQLAFYEQQDIAAATRAYFERKRGGFVKIESAVAKFDPESVLELRKIDKTGAVHEFNSSELTNGHMAILLAIWACGRASFGNMLSEQMTDDGDVSLDDDDDDSMMPFSLNGG